MKQRTNTARWIESAGRWQINVQLDGRRRTFTSAKPGRTGQREANAKADAWLDDGIERVRRIAELAEAYLEDCKIRTSLSNYRGEEYRCRVWIIPNIGHIKLTNLSDQTLQRVITVAYSKGMSEKTLKNIRATLAALCKFGRRSRWMVFRPEEISIPKGAKKGKRTILQPEHLVTLFSVDTTLWRGKRVKDPNINAYRLQVATGLRPGELLGLMKGDRRGNVVSVQRSINVLGEITAGKNDNARRRITLTTTAQSIWDAQAAESDGIYLFPGLKEQTYRRQFERYCQSNGLPHVTAYELRHTFVSVVQTLPEGWVKSLVGHSRDMDTFGTYGHTITGQDDAIAARVQAVFDDILRTAK